LHRPATRLPTGAAQTRGRRRTGLRIGGRRGPLRRRRGRAVGTVAGAGWPGCGRGADVERRPAATLARGPGPVPADPPGRVAVAAVAGAGRAWRLARAGRDRRGRPEPWPQPRPVRPRRGPRPEPPGAARAALGPP